MKRFIKENILGEYELPKHVKISTMSATCSLGVNILLENINSYMKLSSTEIMTIKFANKIKSTDKAVMKIDNTIIGNIKY